MVFNVENKLGELVDNEVVYVVLLKYWFKLGMAGFMLNMG